MAEEKKQEQKKQEKKLEQTKKKAEKPVKEDLHESLIRIYSYDIPGSKQLYPGLTRIKGVSWTISNAICLISKIPRNKRISELSKDEIKQIETLLDNINIPDFLKNRRADPTTGKTDHIIGTDLDITKDFDIKRLKKMKSYVGVRHSLGQPVRGQRTRSHFRKNKIAAVGAKKPTKPGVPAPAPVKK
jgi:small subunit ribosomal protein S13